MRHAGWTKTRDDMMVLVGVGMAYLLIRVVWAPVGGPARFHLTDLLAGVAIPSLSTLFFRGWAWQDWSRSLGGKLSVTLGAAIMWEGILPLLSTQWTADPVDAACYLIGALIQHALTHRSGS